MAKNIIRHKIVYIDERKSDLRVFQRRFSDFQVVARLPKEDLGEFIGSILSERPEAVVVDFNLAEYRTDVTVPIKYNGVDIVEKIWEIHKGFPCIVLTSYDDDAIQHISDVNYVYSKDLLGQSIGKMSLMEKLRFMIEHYQTRIENAEERFDELIQKRNEKKLNYEEEDELLKLDSFLESAIDNRHSLSYEKKQELTIGTIKELLDSTNELLAQLKKEK